MNTITVLVVLSVCCSLSYCGLLRKKRFVPNPYATGLISDGLLSDAMKDMAWDHFILTGTFPSWMQSLLLQQQYPGQRQQYRGQGQPFSSQGQQYPGQSQQHQGQGQQYSNQGQQYPGQGQQPLRQGQTQIPSTGSQTPPQPRGNPMPANTNSFMNPLGMSNVERLIYQKLGLLEPPKLWPGKRVNDPRFGKGRVFGADGSDGQVMTTDGQVVSVDGTDVARSGDMPPLGVFNPYNPLRY